MRKLLTYLMAVLLVFVSLAAHAESALRISVIRSQSQFILREPVKLRVLLYNDGNDPINIPEVQHFDMNMEFFRFEIQRPDGRRETRRSSISTIDRIYNPAYKGEVLASGESIQFFLYPMRSFVLDSDRGEGGELLTFNHPGQYRVRVCYVVTHDQPFLYGYGTGGVCSEEVLLTFRQPNSVEKDILDALWFEATGAMTVGEMRTVGVHDIAKIRSMLDEHPNHPLSPYLEYAIARTYVTQGSTLEWHPEKAVPILRDLMDRYPEFRPEEVRFQLGEAYRRSGLIGEAVELYEQTLAQYPELRNDYAFMASCLRAQAVDSNEYGANLQKWIMERATRGRNLVPRPE